MIDDFGLRESLTYLVEDWRARCPQVVWQARLRSVDDDLDDAVQVTVYRAVQECLTNAARHSGATRVIVAVSPTKRDGVAWLEIEVADDGAGMAEGCSPGLGLTGLQERVAALGGTFDLARSEDGGLAVRLAIPACSGGDGM